MKKSPLYTRGNRQGRSAVDETKWCIFNNEYYRLNTEIDRRKKYKPQYESQRLSAYKQSSLWKPDIWEVISPLFMVGSGKSSRTHDFFKTHAEAIAYVDKMNKEIKKAIDDDAKFYEGKRDTAS